MDNEMLAGYALGQDSGNNNNNGCFGNGWEWIWIILLFGLFGWGGNGFGFGGNRGGLGRPGANRPAGGAGLYFYHE